MSNALASAPLDAAAFVKSQIRTVPDWPQPACSFAISRRYCRSRRRFAC